MPITTTSSSTAWAWSILYFAAAAGTLHTVLNYTGILSLSGLLPATKRSVDQLYSSLKSYVQDLHQLATTNHRALDSKLDQANGKLHELGDQLEQVSCTQTDQIGLLQHQKALLEGLVECVVNLARGREQAAQRSVTTLETLLRRYVYLPQQVESRGSLTSWEAVCSQRRIDEKVEKDGEEEAQEAQEAQEKRSKESNLADVWQQIGKGTVSMTCKPAGRCLLLSPSTSPTSSSHLPPPTARDADILRSRAQNTQSDPSREAETSV